MGPSKNRWTALAGAQAIPLPPASGSGLGDPIELLFRLLYSAVKFVVGEVRAARPGPQVNLVDERVRFGAKNLAFADINRARLVITGEPDDEVLDLRLGNVRGVFLSIPLREGERVVLDEAWRPPLIAILQGSSIDIPVSQYDPNGRYARAWAPQNVTKDEAIALVTSPPLRGDDLPTHKWR